MSFIIPSCTLQKKSSYVNTILWFLGEQILQKGSYSEAAEIMYLEISISRR